MSNDKEDNEAILAHCEQKENSSAIQESSFVTPGIFRRRKMLAQMTDEGFNNAKENSEDFKWSIDQIAKICPIEFDETEEFSLPPEDWDPGAEFSRPRLENVDHFWTSNIFIAPSPELFGTATPSRRFHSSDSSSISSQQLVLSPLNSAGPSCSPKCPLYNSTFMSPTMILTHSQMSESKTRIVYGEDKATTSGSINETSFIQQQMIVDGSEDFEQLERSLSFEVADCIAADMDNGEAFVFMKMRKECPSVDPIEEGN